MPSLHLISEEPGSAVTAYSSGPRTFSLLFTRWMDGNEWSHPIMTSLATAANGGKNWLHSSQISGFRHASTTNPGPRTFVAIERLNFYVHRYQTQQQLIPGTKSSNNYNYATAITEGGAPPPLGWWFEIFCGYRRPLELDLSTPFIPPDRAEDYSAALGRLIRDLLVAQQYDLVDDLDRLIHRHYPTHEDARVAAFAGMVLGKHAYTADQLLLELPSMTRFTAALEGPATEDDLLNAMKG